MSEAPAHPGAPAPEAPSAAAPDLSVIVPLFNQLPLTRAMLDSLQATLPSGLSYEVLLIDDGSTDGTREWLSSLEDPRLRPLLNEHNLGYAASNNRAVSQARAPLLALLNNDLLLRPGWFEPMLEALESSAPLSTSAATQAPSTGMGHGDSEGKAPSDSKEHGAPEGLRPGIVGNLQERALDGLLDHAGVIITRIGKIGHLRSLPSPLPARLIPFAVTGACCLLRRADFLSVGGFDERYCNGGEDIDLCLRLHARGLLSVVATGSRIVHHVSASRGVVSERDERNSRLLYSTWHDTLAELIADTWLEGTGSGPQLDPPIGDPQESVAALPAPAPTPRHPQPATPSGRLVRDPAPTREKALLLARSALWREESRWRRLFDTQPAGPAPAPAHGDAHRTGHSPAPAAGVISHTGFRRRLLSSCPFIPRQAEIHLAPGTPSTDLLVRCTVHRGLLALLVPAVRIGLRVSVNGLHTVEWPALPPGRHSLVVVAPATLPDRPTLLLLEPLVTLPNSGLLSRLLRPLLPRRLSFRRLTADNAPLLELQRWP